MKECKGCNGTNLIKNGKKQLGVQRYKCKNCKSSYIEGDKRFKHSKEKRRRILEMYLEGMGIRSIERLVSI